MADKTTLRINHGIIILNETKVNTPRFIAEKTKVIKTGPVETQRTVCYLHTLVSSPGAPKYRPYIERDSFDVVGAFT